MAAFIYTNNAQSTIGTSIGPSATSIALASGTGALFPSPAAGQQFAVTLVSASVASQLEIVYCTSRTGDTLTVVRAQETTTAQSWPVGTLVMHEVTAGEMNGVGQLAASNTWSGANGFQAITATTIAASGTIGGANAATTGQMVTLGQANGLYALVTGTTSGSFYVNSGSSGAEGDLGVYAAGQNSCYMFNNSTAWGLNSASGGVVFQYLRSSSAVILGGTSASSSSATFYANSGLAAEGGIGALANGQNGAYLFNNASAWGLSSTSGGSILQYIRSSGQIAAGGTLSITAGTAAAHAVNLGQFASSLSGNGYKKYPDSASPSGFFIEQWGTIGLNAFPQNVFFPLSFPNACLQVVGWEGAASGWASSKPTIYGVSAAPPVNYFSCAMMSWNGTTFVVASSSVTGTVRWMAKGY